MVRGLDLVQCVTDTVDKWQITVCLLFELKFLVEIYSFCLISYFWLLFRYSMDYKLCVVRKLDRVLDYVTNSHSSMCNKIRKVARIYENLVI